jgi:hypothetical protein
MAIYPNDDDEDGAIVASLLYLICNIVIIQLIINQSIKKKPGSPYLIKRNRKTMEEIYLSLGKSAFRRTYRMNWHQFCMLVKMIDKYLFEKKSVGPNGQISTEIEVAITIRYLAGGSAYDIMLVHGIGYTTMFRCLWRVVSAINNNPQLKIRFPTDHQAQRSIATGFEEKSKALFKVCVGCIDGFVSVIGSILRASSSSQFTECCFWKYGPPQHTSSIDELIFKSLSLNLFLTCSKNETTPASFPRASSWVRDKASFLLINASRNSSSKII